MDVFHVLTLIGGLSLFLFGMNIMGEGLERRAGSRLQGLLARMTSRKWMGFLTGLGVTAIIQSSSATTVMVVGFVNSGLMTLKQSIGVIMGANIGTTVTAWILSLSGIDSGSVWVQLLKPSSFTPVLALVGVVLLMFQKDAKRRDTGTVLLGFATLMYGMETMSGAVSGLADVPAFRELFLMFQNPVLGVLVGCLLTAIIQSSSASVGILQALAVTGQITYAAAIPIIMGQNIGTCVTALISSVGTNKNARRAAMVHLSFNVIGTVVWLSVFSVMRAVFAPAILGESASLLGIAVAHTAFNVLCTALLLPLSGLLERLAYLLVPETKEPEKVAELDDRLLDTPPIALEQCRSLTITMADTAIRSLKNGLELMVHYTPERAASVRADEDETDHYEDILGTYLVKLSSRQIGKDVSAESAELLRLIGDFERIADHAVNLAEAAEELHRKSLSWSPAASADLAVLSGAVREILDWTRKAFAERDLAAAAQVEPLEQVIDGLKEEMRARHIARLQTGDCTSEAGFVWADLLTNLERTADHCSNIAGCILDMTHYALNLHESLRAFREDDALFREKYQAFAAKYALA